MRFRFTPLVKRFTKFANIVIRDFIKKARNLKALSKEFDSLETGYDFLLAYISHFSKLKKRNVLFQNQYEIDFGKDLSSTVFVEICKQDKSKSKAEFLTDGAVLKNNVHIPVIRLFTDKIRANTLKFLRKRFGYVEMLRKYIVHEVTHLYQFLAFDSFADDELYIGPDRTSKYFNLESFLYLFQREEIDAMIYESLHKWNVNRRKDNFVDIFVSCLSEQLYALEQRDYTCEEFFDSIKNLNIIENNIICNFLFLEYLPQSKFSKYFNKLPGLNKIKKVSKNAGKIADKLFNVYKDIVDGLPVPKKFVSACKNKFAFNEMLCNLVSETC